MPPSRRRFLLSSAAIGGALTGCVGTGRQGAPTPNSTSTDTPVPTPPPTGPSRRTARQTGAERLAVAGPEAAYVVVDDTLRALSLADGRGRWHRSAGRPVALVHTGEGLLSLGADGTVRHDALDGSDRWTTDLGVPGLALARGGDAVVALGTDGTVAALALGDGSGGWRETVDGAARGLVTDDERAYVATGEHVHALALADGAERWRSRPGHEVTTAPTLVDGRPAVGVLNPGWTPGGAGTPTPSPTDAPVNGGVVAHARDGSEAWTTGVEGEPAWLARSSDGPLVGYGGFTFESLATQPQVSGLSRDGRERWRRRPVPQTRPAAVTRGVALHVDPAAPEVRVSDDERVRRGQTALRTGDGESVWTRETGAAAAAAAGEVFVTVEDDAVRARGALNGAERWSVRR